MAVTRPESHSRISLRRLLDSKVLVRQTHDGSRNAYGEWEAGETVEVTLPAHVQPAKGDAARERSATEAGIELSAMLRAWLQNPLNPSDAQGSPGDIVVVSGEEYRVHSVQDWGGIADHLLIRIEGQ